MIAWITAPRLPWKLDFSNTKEFLRYRYEFGPYVLEAETNGYRNSIQITKEGKTQQIYCDGTIFGFVRRRVEVWLHRNSDMLMRTYL